MVPDLIIAFDASRESYRQDNGYVISRQGKAPHFVTEMALPGTGRHDVEVKRPQYADLGIPEYWRFDETGDLHGAGWWTANTSPSP